MHDGDLTNRNSDIEVDTTNLDAERCAELIVDQFAKSQPCCIRQNEGII